MKSSILRTALAALALGAALGCVSGPNRLELYRALSQPAKDAYDKYHQFMTEPRQEAYLTAKSDEERQRMIADLHVEERLARYPDYIQKAIWSQEVVAGMDKEAVLLTWGRPDSVERPFSEDSQGVDREIWSFRRGAGDVRRVEIVQGVVLNVERK
ncbi:MAG: hypothetical protein ACOX6T_12165 [Myxococcales bacterium]|jgi:hypothetical protein